MRCSEQRPVDGGVRGYCTGSVYAVLWRVGACRESCGPPLNPISRNKTMCIMHASLGMRNSSSRARAELLLLCMGWGTAASNQRRGPKRHPQFALMHSAIDV